MFVDEDIERKVQDDLRLEKEAESGMLRTRVNHQHPLFQRMVTFESYFSYMTSSQLVMNTISRDGRYGGFDCSYVVI